MTKRIIWINPVGSSFLDDLVKDSLTGAAHAGTSVDVVSLGRGPAHLKYHYYEALVLVDMLHRVRRSEQQGYDGCIIGCVDDPGVREAREIANELVVTGCGEACFRIAASLARRFAVIVNTKKAIPGMRDNLARYGLCEESVLFRAVGMEIGELQLNRSVVLHRIARIAREVVAEDLAEVIVLGCTAQVGLYEELQRSVGVPVIDPVIATLKYMEFLIGLKREFDWHQGLLSRYERPPEQELEEWDWSYMKTGEEENGPRRYRRREARR